MSEQKLSVKIELSVPDARELLALLLTSPDNWPDVIEALEGELKLIQG
jgi:hypothetical protein